jgi:heterotetrameric sarcosine oxidase gamma subunit
MTLITASKKPVASPLGSKLSSASPKDSGGGVDLAEITSWQMLHIRGMKADDVAAHAYNVPSMGINAVTITADGILVRLRRDEFVLLTCDLVAAMERAASQPADSLLTLTDISHGRAVFCLSGVAAPDVLAKVCGLDFADSKFPDRSAAQTSLAKVRTLIVYLNNAQTPAYFLIVDRSLAGYIWETVCDAAQEFGSVVQGQQNFSY